MSIWISVSIIPCSSKRTYRFQGVSSGVDEEQTTMDTSIGDMSITKGSKLLSKVGRMLVFDLFVSLTPTLGPIS